MDQKNYPQFFSVMKIDVRLYVCIILSAKKKGVKSLQIQYTKLQLSHRMFFLAQSC